MSLLLIPLLALIGPEGPSKAAAVAPFVGEDAFAVARVDLARWEPGATPRLALGRVLDDPGVAAFAAGLNGRIAQLKALGAADLYLVAGLADLPGYPLAVVPLTGKADGPKLAEALTSAGPAPRWPKAEVIRGAVVAGSAAALERVRASGSPARPELAEALDSAGDPAVSVALIPSTVQRRALSESFPTLPPDLGGGPIEVVTRGIAWASMAMAVEPKPTVRVVVRGRDDEAARALGKVARDGLAALAKPGRLDPAAVALAAAASRYQPEVDGASVRLEVPLAEAASLASVPIFQARDAARRRECVNQMKNFGLAMHNYHSAHGSFPPAYVAGKDGKPLLSWRVLILPYLEQKSLFDEFHLDEPWDSPHNKPLIARMPKVYACPGESGKLAAEGKTTYLVPRGPSTAFPGAEGVKINDISDGSSNTILVVEASDALAVTWTRPDDWMTAPDFATLGLFSQHGNGTNFLFGDGSVRFLKATIAPSLLKALTTPKGGEVLDADSY